VVRIERDVLLHFGLIHALQNGQSVAHAGDAHFLQLIVFQSDERFADDFVF
jgi:hypothetical protein